MSKKLDQIVNWCIWSMENEPHKWDCDEFSCDHENGIRVWIANGYYGMGIYLGRDGKVGGVTGRSAFFGRLIPWRRRLRHAALKLLNRTSGEDAVMAVIEKSTSGLRVVK